MPETTEAVTCRSCGKMHPAKNGRYIIVTATVKEAGTPPNFDPDDPPIKQTVVVKDVAVCNNECLAEMLSLKGFS